jgi:L-asparagine oxygenase
MVFIQQCEISASVRKDLERFVQRIDGQDLDEHESYKQLTKWSISLPAELQHSLLHFQYERACDALHIQGIPVGKVAALTTPLNHNNALNYPVYGFQAACLAISRMLGYVVGFKTQQHGRLCNNIVPLEGDENTSNISSGYRYAFDFHNEDAFMAYPPDYFQLACVRNPTDTPLTVSGIDEGDLPGNIEELLRRPQFLIRTNVVQARWEDRISASPVISGPVDHPYLRYNGPRSAAVNGGGSSAAALRTLSSTLSHKSQDISLKPGDLAIVKNHRLCHARRPYPAKCDGTDRWMVRLIVFRCLWSIESFMPDPDFPIMEPV